MFKRRASAPVLRYRFVPQPDITAYELARIYAAFGHNIRLDISEDDKHQIPEDVKRHFFRVIE